MYSKVGAHSQSGNGKKSRNKLVCATFIIVGPLPNVRKVGTGRLTGKYISIGRGIGVIVLVKGEKAPRI